MNTKDVCNKLRITSKALRIYEEKGLVVPKRDGNGYRNYHERDLIKLREIVLLKDLGFSLEDIKILISKNIDDENSFIRSLYFQRQAIKRKIRDLKNVELTLNNSIEDMLNNDRENNIGHLETLEQVLKKNKVNQKNWVDHWSFDTWAKSYDNSVKTSDNDELELFKDYDVVLDKVRSEMDLSDSKKILDLGCGTGNLTGLYSDTHEVHGIDQSLEMLLHCKKKFPSMKLKLGNFLDESYVEGVKFDYIVSTFAFHHLKEQEKEEAIDKMLRSLNPNGKIVIGDLMFLNEGKREEKRKEYMEAQREDLWEVVEDEFYGDVEKIKGYVEFKGLKFQHKHLVNFTWLIVIGG